MFAKLQKATVSFVMSVCAWNNLVATGKILMKSVI
jgi:hypothetical protein